MKLIETGRNFPHFRFLAKTTHIGKEHPWDIEKELCDARYYDSPTALRMRKEFIQQVPFVFLGFIGMIAALFFVLWVIGFFLKS